MIDKGNLSNVLRYLFPDKTPENSWVVSDKSDGNGPFIEKWLLEELQPTQQEIDDAEIAAMKSIKSEHVDARTKELSLDSLVYSDWNTRIDSFVASGLLLKNRINSCVTLDEIDSINDSRS